VGASARQLGVTWPKADAATPETLVSTQTKTGQPASHGQMLRHLLVRGGLHILFAGLTLAGWGSLRRGLCGNHVCQSALFCAVQVVFALQRFRSFTLTFNMYPLLSPWFGLPPSASCVASAPTSAPFTRRHMWRPFPFPVPVGQLIAACTVCSKEGEEKEGSDSANWG
jgi:hypothetical protein